MCAVPLPVQTPDGIFTAHYSERGLAALNFPGAGVRSNFTPANLPTTILQWHAWTERAVRAVLAGKPITSLPPLDLAAGTAFQRRVWKELRNIPLGETRSYGKVADAVGVRHAARAVGRACGANPIPLLIPCHRVLAANRKLGGFSGGPNWKKRLLKIEGVRVAR